MKKAKMAIDNCDGISCSGTGIIYSGQGAVMNRTHKGVTQRTVIVAIKPSAKSRQ